MRTPGNQKRRARAFPKVPTVRRFPVVCPVTFPKGAQATIIAAVTFYTYGREV